MKFIGYFISMSTKEFYNAVILTEDTSTAFLREHHLLLDGDEVEPSTRCGSEMVEKKRRDQGGEFPPFGDDPKKVKTIAMDKREENYFRDEEDYNQAIFGKGQKSSKRKIKKDFSSVSDCHFFESDNSDSDYEDEDTGFLATTNIVSLPYNIEMLKKRNHILSDSLKLLEDVIKKKFCYVRK
ncbi:hypothetical protein FQA39_LY16229 [Lamprigera yunnana]|nr:hypothetical protein FQA39_LY16229 [Lamprigera yunnana]